MFCFHSSHDQNKIKHQIKQLLDWEMDVNIDLIAKNDHNERVFDIKTEHGTFFRVKIIYYSENRSFVELY